MDQKPVLYSLGVASAVGITTKNALLTVATLVGAYFYFNMNQEDARYATNSDLSVNSTTLDPYKPNYVPEVFPINQPNHVTRSVDSLLAIR